MTNDQSMAQILAEALSPEGIRKYQQLCLEAARKAVKRDQAYTTVDALVEQVRTTSQRLSVHNGIIGPGGSSEHTGTDYTSLFSIEHPLVKTLEYRGLSIVRPGDRIIANVFIGVVVDPAGRPLQMFDGAYHGEELRIPVEAPGWGTYTGYHLRELQEKEIITSFEGRTPEGHSYFVD